MELHFLILLKMNLFILLTLIKYLLTTTAKANYFDYYLLNTANLF